MANLQKTTVTDGLDVTGSLKVTGEISGSFVGTFTGDTSTSTDDINEGSNNLYFTDARARAAVSAVGNLSYNSSTGVFSFTQRTDAEVRGLVSVDDVSGDGSLSYNNSTGVFTYTGPSAAEVRAHFNAGTGIGLTNGMISVDTTNIATKNYVDTKLDDLIDSAPGTLDTLNELAAALGDDPDFATTITTSLAGKQDASTALTINTVFGGDVSGTYSSIVIADNAVENSMIANSAVTAAKLATNSISTGKIQDSAVTGVKINDYTISANKLQQNSVETLKIKDAAVTNQKLENSSLEITASSGIILKDNTGTIQSSGYSLSLGESISISASFDNQTIGLNEANQLKVKDGSLTVDHLADSAVLLSTESFVQTDDYLMTAAAIEDYALPKSGGQMTGNITFSGAQTVDGRDLSADGSKLDGIEAGADVTDTTNVTSALVAASISSGDKTTIQSNLGVDAAGTDNSTDVTLAGTPDYITISGQTITRNLIDLANDVTGDLPISKGGTGASTAAAARSNLGVDAAGTDNSTDVTIAAGKDYISISGQELTLGTIDISDDTNLVDGTGLVLSDDTLSVDLSQLTGLIPAMTGDDQFVILDESNSYADRRKTASEIGLSIFNNDAGFTTNAGTVTGTGTAYEIPVWIGTDKIRNSGLLYLNNLGSTSTRLGINTSSPEKTLDVDGPVKLGNDSTHSSLLTGSFNLLGSLTINKDTSGANSDYDITFKNTSGNDLGRIYTEGTNNFKIGSVSHAWLFSSLGNTYIRSYLSDVDIGAPEVLISGSSGTYIFNQSYFGGTNTSDKVSTFTSDGKLGISTLTPTCDLDVEGDVRLGSQSNNKIFMTGSVYLSQTPTGTGTDVLIRDSANKIVTDSIDSRVFDSDLVDRAEPAFANYVALWSGARTITYDGGLYYNPSSDFLGIGTTSPQARLDVRRNTSTSTNNAYSKFVATFVNQNTADSTFPGPTYVDSYVMSLRIAEVSTEGGSTGDLFLACYSNSNGTSNGTREFYISGNGTTGTTFTSQHFTVYKTKNGSSAISDEIEPGMIIEAIGERGIDRDNETAIPVVSICSSRNSKKVFGVLSSDYEGIYDMAHWRYFNGVYNEDCRYEYEEEDGTTTVVGEYSDDSPYFKARSNSGGEGKIWITNLHGNVENGDFISSSEIAGFGALQEDDIMRSCTVAKCTEDIDWDSVNDTVEFQGKIYKKYLAFCTYHCG